MKWNPYSKSNERKAWRKSDELDGQIALVTGAGVRLGRAIALGLAESGCDVIVHYNKSKVKVQNTVDEIKRLGRRAKLLRADLSKEKQALKLARDAEKAFGRVDILINSPAIFWPTPPEKLNAKELNAFLDIDLKSPYILSSEIGQRMKKRGAGAIVNLACTSAFKPWKQFVPYSISKAGVVALTIGMAKVLSPQVP